MATNTKINVGIRLDFSGLGMRNYEPKGGMLYLSARDGLEYASVAGDPASLYDVGDVVPFDAKLLDTDLADNCYSADALMEEYFNYGWLTPVA